ncbi:T9SS type A sorting domain-containing protein [bacterium]|nr:T9SS type A sorting domain-containing protein [bacterium]
MSSWRNHFVSSLKTFSFLTVPLLLMILLPCSLSAQLSGTYTIGSGGDYTTFNDAITALNSSGISGAVTFNVLAGSYNESIVIGEITGASAVNTVTFDGGSGNAATRILTYAVPSADGSVVTLNGADYVRIRNISIVSTDALYGYGIKFSNSADYNEITGCNITLPENSASYYHRCIVTAPLSGRPGYEDYGSYNLISGNTIRNGLTGIEWHGPSQGNVDDCRSNHFIGNTILNFHDYGIYIYYGAEYTIVGNTIHQRDVATSGGNACALYVSGIIDGATIARNYVSSRVYGMRLNYLNYYAAEYATPIRVYNNMIVVDGTGNVRGLYMFNCKKTDVIHNSLRVTTLISTAYGIYSSGSSTSDNICANNMISVESSGAVRPIYVLSANPFAVFDYNIAHVFGQNVYSTVWRWGGVNYISLDALKSSVTGFHQHSLDADPEWLSPTDLHTMALAAYRTGLGGLDLPLDYDGETRYSSPCIGADEYVLCDLTCPDNIVLDNDAGLCSAVATFMPTATIGCGTVTCNPPSGSIFPVGTTTVDCYTDAGPQCSFTVTVHDAEAPIISSASPMVLWPVDHGYETVGVQQLVASVADNCDMLSAGDIRIVGAYSDEDEIGQGSGNTLDDIVIAQDCQSVELRRERDGTGDGRVYSIQLAVTDAAGNTGVAVSKVHVSHNSNSAAVEGPALYTVAGPCGAPKQRISAPLPGSMTLQQNYPNPFNPSTTILFSIPDDNIISLRVYDMLGRTVETLAEGRYAAGAYTVQFDASWLAAGRYVYRLEGGGQILQRSMLLIK